ncbi:MAG: hypothetical protein U1F10_04195 [Burkholderiales bacterium]
MRRHRRRAAHPAFGLGYFENDQAPYGQPTQWAHALYVDGEYTWRNVDDLLSTSGWMANVQLGWGIPGASTEQFGRVIGKTIAWVPLSRNGILVLRADAGAVLAQSRVGIPSTSCSAPAAASTACAATRSRAWACRTAPPSSAGATTR